jgi:hypothetical protein
MRIGIVSEESHVNSHRRALEERGHEVVLLGGSPSKIPPTVEVVLLRTVGCSHGASDTAFAWSRAGNGHLIVADGVAATLSAVAAYEAKDAPPKPPPLPSTLTDAQYDKLADRLERAMVGEDGCRMDRGTIFVVGGRKSDLDLIENVAHIAGMRRTGNIAGTSRTVPAKLVQDCSVVVMLEHRTGSRLQQIVSDLCVKACKPLVALDASSGESELLIRLGQAGFPPVNHLVEVTQIILRGRHITECSPEEREAMTHVVLGEHATSRMPSSTRKDRHTILVRTILAQPDRSDEEILNAALDAALHPEKLVEIHPNHIDAAREEVGVVVDDEGNPVAIHGQKMIDAATRYNVGNANIDALPWIVDAPVDLEPEPAPEPEPEPEPDPTPEPEATMPTKSMKPKKFERVRSNGKPYSTPEEKFDMLVAILRERGSDLPQSDLFELLQQRLDKAGYVVPKRMNLPLAQARAVAAIPQVKPDVSLAAPTPVVSAPAAPVSLDERIRAAVASLQAVMREARIVSAQLTPDSAALEVEVVTVTHTTLRF